MALKVTVPSTPDDVGCALAGMQAMVSESLKTIAQACIVLADIGRGMAETHIGSANDQSVLGSTVGVMTGLYWMLSAQYVHVWSDMWNTELWTDKWDDKDCAQAWGLAAQYLNTVRSIVVQQADARIRETQRLDSGLIAER